MRLTTIDRGDRMVNKLFLRFVGWSSRRAAPGVLKTLHYRSSFWGRPYSSLLHDVMRGPSDWTAGERELFAAFTSSLLACRF